MFDYLVNHALKNVWCAPDQDNQVIVKPARITPKNGVWNSYKFLWTTVDLPETVSRFHLYQIGQVHPLFLNLFSKPEQWVTFAEASAVGTTICDIYVSSGIQLPRTQTWYYVTKEKALLIAVKRNDKIKFDFNEDDVYLRVYDNAYFTSTRSQPLNDRVSVEGGVMNNTQNILDLQAKYESKIGLPGGVYCFINGYKQKDISLLNTKVNDVAEFVYDSSIIRVIDFQISGLMTFDSDIDSKGKYLLHYEGNNEDSIDYLDDIDLFIVDASTQKGVYVHKNASDTVRMLSHRDYAVPVAYINAYFDHFIHPVTGAFNLNNLYLRLHVRKSGYLRPLVNEHQRLGELYKLEEVDIRNAMLGVNSNVGVWRAPALEKSAYVSIMGKDRKDISNELVKNAYGYHAITKLVADTPLKVTAVGTLLRVDVPYLLMFDSTVFEYDAQGLLIDWHRHTTGDTYACRSPNAYYVEMIAGEGTEHIDDQYGLSVSPLNESVSYRYYTCPIEEGVVSNNWVDVTGTGIYSATPTQVNWLSDALTYTLVRSDRSFLVYRKQVTANTGVLSFSLTHEQLRSGVNTLRSMEVPMGELDIFMNGHSLIEGLDYIVAFPHVNIVNKTHLKNAATQAQDIVVRFTGFCNQLLKTTPKNEFGFIQHGRVSVNERYDIRDSKVMRIISGGRLQTREDLVFSENTSTYDFTSAQNGQPYLIRDLIVPLKNLVNENTYVFREKSLEVDRVISDYMTVRLPENAPSVVNPIAARYELYSPFFCRLIEGLVSGQIDDPVLVDHYNDNDVRRICAPYEYLLASDPIQIENQLNPDYVIIHPHYLNTETNLDLPRYRFLTKAVRLYGNGRISLATFVKLI